MFSRSITITSGHAHSKADATLGTTAPQSVVSPAVGTTHPVAAPLDLVGGTVRQSRLNTAPSAVVLTVIVPAPASPLASVPEQSVVASTMVLGGLLSEVPTSYF